MTDYTDLIADLRAGHVVPNITSADAIEALQRENARLQCDYDELDAENRNLAEKLMRAPVNAFHRQDWGLSTLRLLADRFEIRGWEESQGQNYPDSIGGEVTPLGNQVDGKPGFT